MHVFRAAVYCLCKTNVFMNHHTTMRTRALLTRTMPKRPHLKNLESLKQFSTSERRPVNPLVMFLFKMKGIQALKYVSILSGRSFRKLHDKLPEAIQRQLSRHKIAFGTSAVILMYIVYYSIVHYDTCPITGRKRWISFTKDQILVLADMDRNQLMDEYASKIIDHKTPLYKQCKSIVDSLISHNQDIDIVKKVDWKLTVIDDPEMNNAFVLPNGEIFLFTGMVDVMSDWQELAIVLGHEMSHAILGHVQEQQSFAVFGELIVVPLLAFIWFLLDDFAAFVVYSIQQFMYPIIFELGFKLPYSRQLESEADEVGLMLASKACFDPRWSVYLWDKLALMEATDALVGKSEIDFEFSSTHPSHEKRAVTLEERIPEAMKMRLECNCPNLEKRSDPLVKAHEMRKFAVNIKAQVKIKEELEQLQKPKRNESESSVASKGEEEIKSLHKKLELLEDEYDKLLALHDQETKLLNIKDQKKSILNSLWSGLVGVFLGNSKDSFASFKSRNDTADSTQSVNPKLFTFRDRYTFSDD
nr:metalloendopeptidase OMA1, mitochondrial-like [Ciona intestinalis]|eukprot:XP_026690756.1 metalloendopeptidase OMA1, mitochondrial-like [Ciona intestinalis]